MHKPGWIQRKLGESLTIATLTEKYLNLEACDYFLQEMWGQIQQYSLITWLYPSYTPVKNISVHISASLMWKNYY